MKFGFKALKARDPSRRYWAFFREPVLPTYIGDRSEESTMYTKCTLDNEYYRSGRDVTM